MFDYRTFVWIMILFYGFVALHGTLYAFVSRVFYAFLMICDTFGLTKTGLFGDLFFRQQRPRTAEADERRCSVGQEYLREQGMEKSPGYLLLLADV